MKKKIIIEGEKVHDVGYRQFLLEKAQELCIPNYYAKNVKGEGREIVEVSLGGEEDQVMEFMEFVKENQPPKAAVSKVKECPDPPGRIMPMDSYVHFLHTEQLSKIAQSGLALIGGQNKMLDKQDKTTDEVKAVGDEVKKVSDEVKAVGDEVKKVGNKVDNLTNTTNDNFSTINTKYDLVSQNMNKILAELVKEREELTKERKEFRKSIEKLVNAILASRQDR